MQWQTFRHKKKQMLRYSRSRASWTDRIVEVAVRVVLASTVAVEQVVGLEAATTGACDYNN